MTSRVELNYFGVPDVACTRKRRSRNAFGALGDPKLSPHMVPTRDVRTRTRSVLISPQY